MEVLFSSLITMYSYKVLHRFPLMFAFLNGSISDHVPHRFQNEMNLKSEEFTGEIYEKLSAK